LDFQGAFFYPKPRERHDMMANFDAPERIVKALANEPTEARDSAEPILATLSTEPMLPMLSIELRE
jgi:hypothetical protein